MCGNGNCSPIYGPGDSSARFKRWAEDFDRVAQKFGRHIPPYAPVTERMPDPCECCGKIHSPKSKALAERLRAPAH